MKISLLKFTLAAIASLGMASTAALADDDLQEMQAISQGLGLITLEQATAKALAAKPGVVEDVDLENRKLGNGWDYEFEIVDADGKEWDVDVDAKTGEVRNVRRDWF